MSSSKLAPVALFVYNRPRHTRRVLAALRGCAGAGDSDLFVYADGARGAADGRLVAEVRRELAGLDGFRQVRVVERETNRGLASNIVEGVSEVVGEYGRIIVLEDDIVVGPHFLEFMNRALDHYRERLEVWHVAGWNYPIDPAGLDELFLWRVMLCWGWATWVDRWRHFERDPEKLLAEFTPEQVDWFNLDGAREAWSQVEANARGEISTWAVFWQAAIARRRGLCLTPLRALTQNIGHDGSGVHCGRRRVSDPPPDADLPERFPETMREDERVVRRLKEYFYKNRPCLPLRLAGRIKRMMLG